MKEYLTQFGSNEVCFFCRLHAMFRMVLPKTQWDAWDLVSQSFNEVLVKNNIEPLEFLAVLWTVNRRAARTMELEGGSIDINSCCVDVSDLLKVYHKILAGRKA